MRNMDGLLEGAAMLGNDSNVMAAYNITSITEVYNTNGSKFTSSTFKPPSRLSVTSFREYHIAMSLVLWLLPVIIFFGTVGNFLSMVVLLTKRMRTTSVNFYLAILAMADTCVLYLSGFKTWLRVMSGFEMLHVSNVGCKMIMFLFLLSLHMSAWLVVAVSVDRFVAVWFPFRSLTVCNVRRAQIVTSVGCVVLSLYNSHVFWTMFLHQLPTGKESCMSSKENIFMRKAFPWVKLTTYSCVPFIIVLILNICIIVKILPEFGSTRGSGNGKRTDRRDADSRATARNIKDSKVTLMLLGVSISWLVLTAPFTLWSLIARNSGDPQAMAATLLAKTVCFLLMYINHGLNFYLYCMTGKKFRIALRDLVFSRCRVARRRRPFAENSMRALRSSMRSHSKLTHNDTLSTNFSTNQK